MKKAYLGLLVLVVVSLSSSTVLAQATLADAQAALAATSDMASEASNDRDSASSAKTVADQQYNDASDYYKYVYKPLYGADMNIDAFLTNAIVDLEAVGDDFTYGAAGMTDGAMDQANAVIAMNNMDYDVAVNQAANGEAAYSGADSLFLDATDKICDAQIWIAYANAAMGL